MRLTDSTFRAADEFHIQQLQPAMAVMVSEGYGFLELPLLRHEFVVEEKTNKLVMSVTEFNATAVTYSGRLIQLAFKREERPLFQKIPLPDTTEPIILFIDKTSDATVPVASPTGVPLCDADYKVFFKLESEHYDNPDAVPMARFTYRHGWELDRSFIAPCVMLRANGALYNQAANYVRELNELIVALKEARGTQQGMLVKAVLPLLSAISVEVEKEADSMSPRHFISLMQQGIQALLSAAELEDDIDVPSHESCKEYVESHFTPYATAYMVAEGIRLTHALISLPLSFTAVAPPPIAYPTRSSFNYGNRQPPQRLTPGEGSRERIDRRKS